ncbi:unnamed protein product [Cuscuta europaea]|uniref:RNase H type-1 domain-containing protein n=1 Tax=Cuscuta europaea TaxID=41803 RepID=A0A9P0ZLA3_CUSEU|nr:unnamed protein product [Cuscuta europaea]
MSEAGVSIPVEVELMGIQEVLSWLKEQEWNFIDVESNSVQAIMEILKGLSVSTRVLLAEDIIIMSRQFTSIFFSHVRRSANTVAHALARVECSVTDRYIWPYNPPDSIIHVLHHALINYN